MADFALETPRLILRQPAKGDAQRQFDLLNTSAIMQHIGGPRPLVEIEQRHGKIAASFAREGFGFLMMIERASGVLVGYCGVKRVDGAGARNPGDHEIGWVVRDDRWRRGYAGEAVEAVLGWAFGPFEAPHVVALTRPANEPSRRLIERFKMMRRPDLDFADRDSDLDEGLTIVYALTADEWDARRETSA